MKINQTKPELVKPNDVSKNTTQSVNLNATKSESGKENATQVKKIDEIIPAKSDTGAVQILDASKTVIKRDKDSKTNEGQLLSKVPDIQTELQKSGTAVPDKKTKNEPVKITESLKASDASTMNETNTTTKTENVTVSVSLNAADSQKQDTTNFNTTITHVKAVNDTNTTAPGNVRNATTTSSSITASDGKAESKSDNTVLTAVVKDKEAIPTAKSPDVAKAAVSQASGAGQNGTVEFPDIPLYVDSNHKGFRGV